MNMQLRIKAQEVESQWGRVFGANVFFSTFASMFFLVTFWFQIIYLQLSLYWGAVAFACFFTFQFLGYLQGKWPSKCSTIKAQLLIGAVLGMIGGALFMLPPIYYQRYQEPIPLQSPESLTTEQTIIVFRQEVALAPLKEESKVITYFISGILLFAFWLGLQRGSEELYISDSMDKAYSQREVKNIAAIRYIGNALACIVAYFTADAHFISDERKFVYKSFYAPGSVMCFAALFNFIFTAIFFKEISPERRLIYKETKEQENMVLKRDQEIRNRVEQSTLAGYLEWEVLRDVEADKVVLIIAKFVFLALCSLYGLLLTSVGLILTDEAITSTLYLHTPQAIYILFTASSVFMFASFISLQFINQFINQSTLLFSSLILGILGALTMMNYNGQQVEMYRFFIGFVLVSLSYSIGRPAALKQISKTVGISHINDQSVQIQLYEYVAFIIGSAWGILSLLAFNSIFVTILTLISFQIVLLFVTILMIERFMTPHWSYQIEQQECIIKNQLLAQHLGGIGENYYYESLNSGEQAREFPVYQVHEHSITRNQTGLGITNSYEEEN